MSRQDWRTPPSLFRLLSERFGPFDLDAAASHENALHRCYYTTEENALAQPWRLRTFANIPFESPEAWVRKAVHELECGAAKTVCMIAVANVSARWFHLAMEHAKLYVPSCRVPYWHPEEEPGSMDRDTCVLVFDLERSPGWEIEPLELPSFMSEIRRLHAEANGQRALSAEAARG